MGLDPIPQEGEKEESYIIQPGLLYEVPQLEGLKEQKFIVSQFWGPDVQDQGVGRAGSFRGS